MVANDSKRKGKYKERSELRISSRIEDKRKMVTNRRWPSVTRIINQLVEILLRILVLYYTQTAFTTSYIRSTCPNKEITHI